MKKWSESLVRSRLSDFLVDDAMSEGDGAIDPATENILRGEIGDKKEIAALKQAIRGVKREVSPATFELLMEELDEIAEDFTWKKSERGRYVSEINDWIQLFHSQLRADSRFDDLYVGAHAELEVVYVVGRAASQKDLDAFVATIETMKPPRKILINANTGNES